MTEPLGELVDRDTWKWPGAPAGVPRHARCAAMSVPPLDGTELVHVLATLANPHRLRVVAALSRKRNYVSQLARELGISRPLLQAHLRKLEAVGLVSAELEVSRDGKAMKFYEVAPFVLRLTPETIAAALPAQDSNEAVQQEGEKGSLQ